MPVYHTDITVRLGLNSYKWHGFKDCFNISDHDAAIQRSKQNSFTIIEILEDIDEAGTDNTDMTQVFLILHGDSMLRLKELKLQSQ